MSALVERLIASRDRLRGFAVPSDDDITEARQVMADAANALVERDRVIRILTDRLAVDGGRHRATFGMDE